MKLIRRLIVVILVLASLTAEAVEIEGINAGVVPVANRSRAALQKALPQAISQVLIKMSGNVSVMTVPAVQNAMLGLNRYVESYSYLTQADLHGQPQLVMRVVFDQTALKKLLQDANQAMWGADRPLTLVWVSLSQGHQANVVASDSDDPMVASVNQQAKQRGIAVIFPAMDLQDQGNMAKADAVLPDQQQIEQMAERYGVHSVLAAAVTDGGNGQLQGEWQLTLNGTPYEWQVTGASVAAVVNQGVDRAADMMANQLATLDSKGLQSTVTVQVDGVQNLNDYVHVISALKRLMAVSDVSVSDMNADTLLLQVKTAGGIDDLVNALQSTADFIAETPPVDADTVGANLFYRWGQTDNNG